MATISDVAKLAGVSPSTVSRTCSNHPSISQRTKERVRKAMAELGYEPNFQATSLATQNSKTFGILLPSSDYDVYQKSFYLEAIRGIGLFCNQKQYMNTIITGQNDEELLQTVQSMVKGGRVEGFILLYSRHDDPVIKYLNSEGILYVLIGKATKDLSDAIYVDNDNIQASRELTNLFISKGHKKIGYISSDSEYNFSQDRKSGYMLALTENSIPMNSQYIVECSGIPDYNNDKIKELLTPEDRPTAIVTSDDVLATLLISTAYTLGLKVPEDLSVASFNDSLLSHLCHPQLTSVDINALQLGIEAASQIINHIENPDLLATKIIVPHRIIERESCSSPK